MERMQEISASMKGLKKLISERSTGQPEQTEYVRQNIVHEVLYF